MPKISALILICLLPFLASCANNKNICPPLDPFNGTTWGDLAVDDVQVRTLYAACAKKKNAGWGWFATPSPQ